MARYSAHRSEQQLPCAGGMKPPPQARQIDTRSPDLRAEPQCVVMGHLLRAYETHCRGLQGLDYAGGFDPVWDDRLLGYLSVPFAYREPVVEQFFARSIRPGHRPSSHSASVGPAHRARFHRRCGGRCRRSRGSFRTEGKSAVRPKGRLTARRSSGSGVSAHFLLQVPFSLIGGSKTRLGGLQPIDFADVLEIERDDWLLG